MRVSVDYQDEQIEFDVSTEALVGSWKGPSGLGPDRLGDALQDALDHPLDFPALRQMMVPGDRVAIALDGSLTGVEPILFALKKGFDEAGVSTQDVTVVVTPESRPELARDLPEGMTLVVPRSLEQGGACLPGGHEGRPPNLPQSAPDGRRRGDSRGASGFRPGCRLPGTLERALSGAEPGSDEGVLPRATGRRSSAAAHASLPAGRAIRSELAAGNAVSPRPRSGCPGSHSASLRVWPSRFATRRSEPSTRAGSFRLPTGLSA